MEIIQHIIKDLETALSAEEIKPVLMWSGGRDSTLLLHLVLSIVPSIPIIQFREDWTPGQMQFSNSLIVEKDLAVLTYAPMHRYALKTDDGLSLVDEQQVDGGSIPVIRDFVHDDSRCGLELSTKKTDQFPFPYNLILVGWRSVDRVTGLESELSKACTIHNSVYFAPLFDLTDEEIAEACAFLNIPSSDFYVKGDEKLDTGNIVACSRCFGETGQVFCPKENKTIPAHVWDHKANLQAFERRLGVTQ